jgi:uncharacterized protein (TIGR02996 family)
VTHDEAFLQAIIESPEDDAPRLIYADFLEDHGQTERAEFIRLQCLLAKLPEDDPRREQLEAREWVLLEGQQEEWVGPLQGFVESKEFWRAFVEAVTLATEDFFTRAESLFGLAPVRHAEFTSGNTLPWKDALARLVASPSLGRLQSVGFRFGIDELSDEVLHVLAASPTLLERLESLFAMECRISEEGLWQVLRSPHLQRLRSLFLSDCHLPGIRPLIDSGRLPDLTSLSLMKTPVGDTGAEALVGSLNGPRLECLVLWSCDCGDDAAEALAGSRHLSRLGKLSLGGNRIGDRGAAALAESPHLAGLKGLNLHRNPISQTVRERLVRRLGDRVYF